MSHPREHLQGSGSLSGGFDQRHVVEALLRQALYDLTERGGNVGLVIDQLVRHLDDAKVLGRA